jgi:hypothetical protein
MLRSLLMSAVIFLSLLGCEPETEIEDPGDGGLSEDLGFEPDEDGGTADLGMSGACESNDDCTMDLPVCSDDGECVECLDNTYCPALQPICTEAQSCSDMGQGVCREDFDCENVEMPICLRLMGGRIGVCVECLSEADCIQSRPVCSTFGRCVADQSSASCTSDDECGPPRRCDAGTCIEREVE